MWSGLYDRLFSSSGSRDVKCKGEMKCLLYLLVVLSLYVSMYLPSFFLYMSKKRKEVKPVSKNSHFWLNEAVLLFPNTLYNQAYHILQLTSLLEDVNLDI